MSDTKVKFATEVDKSVETQTEQEEQQTPKIVNNTYVLYELDGEEIKLRSRVMAAYKKSLERYGKLYEKLAK